MILAEKLNEITGPTLTKVPKTPDDIEDVLSVAFGFFTIVGGITFVIWLIVGALNWMTAEGKPDKIEKSRTHIVNALTGLILLIAAYAITNVVGAVLGLDIFNLANTLDNL